MTAKAIVLIMCGGGLGAVSRYAVALLALRLGGPLFPWGTLAANLSGCFLAGVLYALAERLPWVTSDMRLLLITGYLGALTTFSAFALETTNAIRAGLLLQPLGNVLANTLGGVCLAFAGMWLVGLK